MSPEEIAAVFRAQYGRAVSVLTRVLGDIDRAEDAVQAAFEFAAARWPATGPPPSPAGWIITTARRRAIDAGRRESQRAAKETEAARLAVQLCPDQSSPRAEQTGEDAVPDDRLRMIFTCCHPALAPAAQAALTLRLLGGLSTAEIARAFLTTEPTTAQRIVRAKAKIRNAGIPYRVPRDAELPERLDGVLRVVYLIFNEGHLASAGAGAVRDSLSTEAIRLARLLVELMPDEPEAVGLLALLLLTQARRPARLGPRGELVQLDKQDRAQWDRDLIGEGHDLVRACLRRNRPGRYQLQAAIAAVHADAARFADTDWRQIVALYDQLRRVDPSPVVEVHRAVAVGERDGAAAGLAALDAIADPDRLERYGAFHAARASLLRGCGREVDAAHAYERAIELTENAAERRDLTRRRQALTDRPNRHRTPN